MKETFKASPIGFALIRWIISIAAVISLIGHTRADDSIETNPTTNFPSTNFPATDLQPESQPGWEKYLDIAQPGEPQDEAKAGRTALGTPIYPRTPQCFPAEPRNVFYSVDQVVGTNGVLCPIAYDKGIDGKRTADSEMAVQGQNTWMLWAEGNEAFWGWLQERGYGFVDFLILLDSRKRDTRFKSYGFINQPGMTNSDNGDWLYQNLGLHIDKAALSGTITLSGPPNEKEEPGPLPPDHLSSQGAHSEYPKQPYPALFDAATGADIPNDGFDLNKVISHLPNDGVDPTVYGYPSGVVGLRLFPNPDFFGKTDAAKKARQLWYDKVVKTKDSISNYYKISDGVDDRSFATEEIHDNPDLARPFRVGMSCAFCHVGFHPLNPPRFTDPEKKDEAFEHPAWNNLSSTIGNQYWNPGKAFANTSKLQSFVTYYVRSQQAGTIDTSLVSTDNINNPNTINSVFQVPARLQRAGMKIETDWKADNGESFGVRPPETQSVANLLVPGKEDGVESQPRHTPAVLLDGSDSIGVLGALARVYLNIGTFPEEWGRCDNPVIGFTPQKPFSIATLHENSVYWQTSEQFRVKYLAAFFTFRSSEQNSSTAPMLLKDALKLTKENVTDLGPSADPNVIEHGRQVFLQNCAMCHSSKQPENFDLTFDRDWQKKDALLFAKKAPDNKVTPPEPHYYVPMDYSQWRTFTDSDAYQDYVERIRHLADPDNSTGSASRPPVAASSASPTPSVGSESSTINHAATTASTPSPAIVDAEVTQPKKEGFFENNYLSTDIRVPITLVGTNSGRAVGTNGMRGQVWDNFSSETYKTLAPVGPVRFYNPFSRVVQDRYGNNDTYNPPGNGPGYYRPASLVSIWATAPFLHNNSLGVYNQDPTVRGRLLAFEDAIGKLLGTPEDRDRQTERDVFKDDDPNNHRDGDLRYGSYKILARDIMGNSDPGFVYRTPHLTWLVVQPKFIRPLLAGILGSGTTFVLTELIWVILALVFLFLIFLPGQDSTGGFVWALLGVLLTGILATTGIYYLYLWTWFFWFLPIGAFGLALKLLTHGAKESSNVKEEKNRNVIAGMWSHGFFLVVTLVLGGYFCSLTHGKLGPLVVGPIPKGTPVNLIMNFNPQGPLDGQIKAVSGLARAFFKLNVEHLNKEPKDAATAALALKIFNEEAGLQLLKASKCPDFVLDRGHWFGELLTDPERRDLIEFLKTL